MIRIIFENEHFVICDKENGVLSTPSRFEERDSRICLGTSLQNQLGLQIYPIHRLDFEVSGLVMYGKNANAHRWANHLFESKVVQKTYRALTTSQDFSHIPENIKNSRKSFDLGSEHHFEWRAQVLRGKRRAYETPQGKTSLTLADFVGYNGKNLLRWDLQPVTGRSHQLRFDLSRHGYPIVGDELYGSKVALRPEAIALQAYRIDFSKVQGLAPWGLPDAIEIPCLY